jgi:hypothetical protein
MKNKNIRYLRGSVLSIILILLGINILIISNTTFERIIGITVLLFFGGLLTWSILKKIKLID